MWRIRKLLKAIGIDNSVGAVPAKDAIGKTLWLFVREETFTRNGAAVEKQLTNFDFRKHIPDTDKPAIKGDPQARKSRGSASGDFVKVTSLDKETKEVEVVQAKKPAGKIEPNGEFDEEKPKAKRKAKAKAKKKEVELTEEQDDF